MSPVLQSPVMSMPPVYGAHILETLGCTSGENHLPTTVPPSPPLATAPPPLHYIQHPHSYTLGSLSFVQLAAVIQCSVDDMPQSQLFISATHATVHAMYNNHTIPILVFLCKT